MTLIGYPMCEQAGPKQPVRDVALAERAQRWPPGRRLIENGAAGAHIPAASRERR